MSLLRLRFSKLNKSAFISRVKRELNLRQIRVRRRPRASRPPPRPGTLDLCLMMRIRTRTPPRRLRPRPIAISRRFRLRRIRRARRNGLGICLPISCVHYILKTRYSAHVRIFRCVSRRCLLEDSLRPPKAPASRARFGRPRSHCTLARFV